MQYLVLMFNLCFLVLHQPGADLNQLSEFSEHMMDSEAAIDVAPGMLTLMIERCSTTLLPLMWLKRDSSV